MRTARDKRLGSALVMTLVIVVLITVVTVGYLASVMLETKTAGAGLDQERAYGIAMMGAHEAMSRVRDALGPWDDPYRNFATNAPTFYWSISPGRITRWPYLNVSPSTVTHFALFSESDGTNLVNLNKPSIDGSSPIIGGSNPPDVTVKWVNVLRDPSQPAERTNSVIGRYAFWVDDEGAKININTADGTEKYTTNSLGIGSPSEVNLGVLFGTNGTVPSKEVVQIARTQGFHSPQEVLKATNVPSNSYTSNVFSLTTYSRSPDLNVFGQPKMALIPILGGPGHDATNMVINGITLRPVQEIYPSPSQLPGYKVFNPIVVNNTPTVPWPLAFRAEQGGYTLGRDNDFAQGNWLYTFPNYCYNNGQMLAHYLAGSNAVGQPVQWPSFPGSSSAGFAGKYTPRQIDSIVAQIVSLGSKAISADYPYPASTDYPTNNVTPASDQWRVDKVLENAGTRYNVSPLMFPGWLSRQWVLGMGRAPKVRSILLQISAFGSSAPTVPVGAPGYIPPRAQVDLWVEMWLPAAYRGGNTVIPPQGLKRYFGTHHNMGALNCSDLQRDAESGFPFKSAVLRKPDGEPSYWANQILTSDRGIDFNGNSPVHDDPDQGLAMQHHDPYAFSGGTYKGTGGVPDNVSSPLLMSFMQLDGAGEEWAPGEFRCVRSRFGSLYTLPIQTDADGSTLNIEGGIAVRSQVAPRWFSDPDPVPLESARGENDAEVNSSEMLTGESWSSPTGPGGPGATLRDRHVASTIPVRVSIEVPPGGGISGPVRYLYATTADPLVNKFPGDWKFSDAPSSTMGWGAASPSMYSTYGESAAFRSQLTDPDSYWMPQADCAISTKAQLANQRLIPRSARLPNVGYLQYVRTGIIPDDETVPYQDQHGTPFRLLSFAPSTESANQQTTAPGSQPYPDWALLDLLYVPSTLTPYGGAYEASTNLAYFGTFGGATSGRVNPNGTVIYTTNVTVPHPNVSRTLPMQAVFEGIKVNQQITGSGTKSDWSGGTTISRSDAEALARAVENYIRSSELGAVRLPAEICNIPAIAALRPASTINPTRNDLVRQTLGALTTQGNVFSVWTVGQAILKKPNNLDYGHFEPGDSVLAEVRMHLLVERYLDPGADGVYGNSGNPGTDGVIGSYDDPRDDIDHPFQPRYLYRIVSSEEIR